MFMCNYKCDFLVLGQEFILNFLLEYVLVKMELGIWGFILQYIANLRTYLVCYE